MKIVFLYESALETGIGLFNRGKYFAAHEAWEGLWLRARNARDKQFLQGLIMAAASFLHSRKRECRGAAVLLAKSIPLLKSGVDYHPDLQLNDFIAALEKLGSDRDWCPTATGGQALPRITRSQMHAERRMPNG